MICIDFVAELLFWIDAEFSCYRYLGV